MISTNFQSPPKNRSCLTTESLCPPPPPAGRKQRLCLDATTTNDVPTFLSVGASLLWDSDDGESSTSNNVDELEHENSIMCLVSRVVPRMNKPFRSRLVLDDNDEDASTKLHLSKRICVGSLPPPPFMGPSLPSSSKLKPSLPSPSSSSPTGVDKVQESLIQSKLLSRTNPIKLAREPLRRRLSALCA